MKISDSSSKHDLSCKPPLVIKIYNGWDYLWGYFEDCWNKFTYGELQELKKFCNKQNSCNYKQSRKWGSCGHSFRRETKSRIWYDCVSYHGTMSSIKARKSTIPFASTKFGSFGSSTENYPVSIKSDGVTNTTTLVTNTRPTMKEYSSQSNDAVIAGSVIGVLGLLALLLLSIYCILKRRKADKQEATSLESVTNAVGQNGHVLYVVPENISSSPVRTDEQPPAYHTLDNIPDGNHVYINGDDCGIGQDLKNQPTNNYNNFHGTDIRKSIHNGDYDHTDTEALKVSGRQSEDYNHISTSGRNSDFPLGNQMEDDYNHIRCTDSVISHDVTEYNHIDDQNSGEEDSGYVQDDYNHLTNFKPNGNKGRQTNSENYEREQTSGNKNRPTQRSRQLSKSTNDYANIDGKDVNNDLDDFEPDDTYVYS